MFRRAPSSAEVDSPSAEGAAGRWYLSPLALGLAGALLLWAALPPLEIGPLGWIAPVPWLYLVRRRRLGGAHPYRGVWLAGFVFWLTAIHWLRLPHPATSIGWVALSSYLALYLPAFVWLARVAVHRVGIPLLVAGPVAWTGLELARARLLTGFPMAALGHTQYRWVAVIQISDLAGGYAVSLLVLLVAASLTEAVASGRTRRSLASGAAGAVALAAALGYGQARTSVDARRPGPRVAIIQGSIDADWKADPGKAQRIFDEYCRLSLEAVRDEAGPIALLIWPETMFPTPLLIAPGNFVPADAELRAELAQKEMADENIARFARRVGVPSMLGILTRQYSAAGCRRFNSALVVDGTGRRLGRYDKMHLVMFGEYVPSAGLFPGLYRMTPLPGGITPGAAPRAIDIDGTLFAPNICFETLLPHLIAAQVRQLAAQGSEPDVLVNLTNDAWFWGSSELPMHLACDVFRAVECRKPMLVAANAGISAWIDADGVIRRQAPRRATDVIVARLDLDDRDSLYLRHGDWLAGICLAVSGLWATAPLWPRRQPPAGSMAL